MAGAGQAVRGVMDAIDTKISLLKVLYSAVLSLLLAVVLGVFVKAPQGHVATAGWFAGTVGFYMLFAKHWKWGLAMLLVGFVLLFWSMPWGDAK